MINTSFHVAVDNCSDFDYITFIGNIDAQSEDQFRELPAKVRSQVVKFDFSKAERINSMGIALLLRCFKTIKEQKKAEVRLLALNQTNTMLFRMTGVFLLASLEK